MRRTPRLRILVLLFMALALAVPPGGVIRALAQDGGLQDDNSYVSPQFGYSVTWGADWQARERDVISNPGGYDTLTLRGNLGTLWIQGQGDTESAASAVERRISIEGDPEDVVAMDLESDVARAEMLVGRDKVLIEGYTLDGIDAVVVIVLSARERDFDDALASVHEQVRFNDETILSGVTIDETEDGDVADATAEPAAATADATEDAEDRAQQDSDETRDEVDDGITGEEEDEEETADSPSDEEEVASSIEDGVYTSQLYDYSFAFDEDTWSVEDEIATEESDGVVLLAETGSLTIWSWDAYGADAEACLDGEDAYYANDDDAVTHWELAEDANGEPLEGFGNGYAWAVFTLTFTNDDGEEIELVDYIECREIPGDDAVVVVFASSTPDLYPDHLDAILEVVDTIEIEGERLDEEPVETEEPEETEEPVETEEPEETEEPVETEEPEETEASDTGLSGSLYTSPTYGFTIDIPAQWQILDEQLSGGDEILMLSNGTSDVTIWATDAYQEGDLAGCVDFAAAESGLELELDVNADGEPFRAEGRIEAYANFLYTDESGEQMTHFVSCRHIVEGESVLIISQDVPYGEFANQRKFRAELEESITIPGQ